MRKGTAHLVYETDICCGGYGSGSLVDTLYNEIEEFIKEAAPRVLHSLPLRTRLYIQDDLISAITEEALYQGAYAALGIHKYQVIEKKPLPFSEAIGVYRILQAVRPHYLPPNPDFNNCDEFELITYKENGEVKELYHHYIKGDGGSIFFTITY